MTRIDHSINITMSYIKAYIHTKKVEGDNNRILLFSTWLKNNMFEWLQEQITAKVSNKKHYTKKLL